VEKRFWRPYQGRGAWDDLRRRNKRLLGAGENRGVIIDNQGVINRNPARKAEAALSLDICP